VKRGTKGSAGAVSRGGSLKAVVARTISGLLTSAGLRDARRAVYALRRRLRGTAACVQFFHQADDPYSQLLLQVLSALVANYEIRIELHLVPPPDDAAAPDRERLQAWSRRDARDLATALGLEFEDPGHQPDPAATETANRALAAALLADDAVEAPVGLATTIGRALWRGDQTALERLPAVAADRAATIMDAGAALRRKLGHYLGATLYFEGEWYWGVDRLGHLEKRLRGAGLARTIGAPPIVRLPPVEYRHRPTNGHRPELHFFCSLRSPYTYLAVPRVLELAARYDALLHLRFVLPMVMRGLPVPRDKRLYILRDAKREAESLGLPFGRIVDPVGAPAERGLAVLHRSITVGDGPRFLESFMRGVWSEGIDAGSDAGLHALAGRAGLDEAFVTAALADASWRAVARANREAMLALGLWGVPSFRVDGNPARWGQDRLWLVERDLIAATQAAPVDRG
jgi:2-hydroxychromene-2-carboxylate isomerase